MMRDLRRDVYNAVAVVNLDRVSPPRDLEDLIDLVEYYGVYVKSLTGNIDLTTDDGISATRHEVNQRNSESRNISRRVSEGNRRAAWKGRNHGAARGRLGGVRMSIEQVAKRIGWGDFLDVAAGTAERISLLIDLITLHGIKVGDLEPNAREGDEPALGERLSEPVRLALAWRSGRRKGLYRAFRITIALSRVGRSARRSRIYWYPEPVIRLLGRIGLYSRDTPLPANGWVRAPLDLLLIRVDAVRAWRDAKSAPDIRRLEEIPNLGG